jgi:hypothetical protein
MEEDRKGVRKYNGFSTKELIPSTFIGPPLFYPRLRKYYPVFLFFRSSFKASDGEGLKSVASFKGGSQKKEYRVLFT